MGEDSRKSLKDLMEELQGGGTRFQAAIPDDEEAASGSDLPMEENAAYLLSLWKKIRDPIDYEVGDVVEVVWANNSTDFGLGLVIEMDGNRARSGTDFKIDVNLPGHVMGSPREHSKRDVRILQLARGEIVAFWMEARQLRKYRGDVAQIND